MLFRIRKCIILPVLLILSMCMYIGSVFVVIAALVTGTCMCFLLWRKPEWFLGELYSVVFERANEYLHLMYSVYKSDEETFK